MRDSGRLRVMVPTEPDTWNLTDSSAIVGNSFSITGASTQSAQNNRWANGAEDYQRAPSQVAGYFTLAYG